MKKTGLKAPLPYFWSLLTADCSKTIFREESRKNHVKSRIIESLYSRKLMNSLKQTKHKNDKTFKEMIEILIFRINFKITEVKNVGRGEYQNTDTMSM